VSITDKVVKGSAVLLISKLVLRLGGLISMLILARLLDQKDFGLVAIASSFVFLFDILSDAGTQQYIVQKKDLTDDDLNTAWTLNLILKGISWLVFVLCVPLITDFFDTQELTNILLVISLTLPIAGLENTGIFLFYRNFDFTPVLKITTIEKIASLIVVISLAIIYRSYWAMVTGVLLTFSIRTLASYHYSSFRPTLSLRNVLEQWAFSKWLLLKGGVGFSRAEFDTFMVTKLFGVEFVGGYNMMKNIANIPGRDLIAPATEPLLTSFAKVREDKERLNYQISLSLFVVCLISFPIASYTYFFADNIVFVLLGAEWLSFSSVLSIMSLLILAATLMSIFQNALTATGKVNIVFYYDLLSLFFVVGVLLAFAFKDVEIFVLVRCALSIVTVVCMFFVISKIFNIPTFRMISLLLPIIIIAYLTGYLTSVVRLRIGQQEYLNFFLLPSIYFTLYVLLCLCYFYQKKHVPEVSHVSNMVQSGIDRVREIRKVN